MIVNECYFGKKKILQIKKRIHFQPIVKIIIRKINICDKKSNPILGFVPITGWDKF